MREHSIEEWKNEVTANALVRQQDHFNILPLLHAHMYGPHCNLIFPLAAYNLSEYYRTAVHPTSGLQRLRFIEKVTRLIPALGAIHHGGDDSDLPSHVPRVGYHRDIKPDNILVFDNSLRFVISDLGLMKFHEIKADSPDYSGVEPSAGTSAYGAPECGIRGKKVGRSADIWSMGCILTEAIVWCVDGNVGRGKFEQQRKTIHPEHGYEENSFFVREKEQRGGQIARLKARVIEWFDEFKATAGDPLIADCMQLLQTIFNGDPRRRPTAEKLDCEFYVILRRHVEHLGPGIRLEINEPTYCHTPVLLPETGRQTLPLSYSRSSSRISLKRRRSENEFKPPSLYMGFSSIAAPRPSKKKREISAFVHLKRLDTASVPASTLIFCMYVCTY